jgi:hypothetical protein
MDLQFWGVCHGSCHNGPLQDSAILNLRVSVFRIRYFLVISREIGLLGSLTAQCPLPFPTCDALIYSSLPLTHESSNLLFLASPSLQNALLFGLIKCPTHW